MYTYNLTLGRLSHMGVSVFPSRSNLKVTQLCYNSYIILNIVD